MDEQESAAREEREGETPWGCNRTGEDPLKALSADLRACERIERGVVSTNPFSTFLILPPAARDLAFTSGCRPDGRRDTMSGLIRTGLIKRDKEKARVDDFAFPMRGRSRCHVATQTRE